MIKKTILSTLTTCQLFGSTLSAVFDLPPLTDIPQALVDQPLNSQAITLNNQSDVTEAPNVGVADHAEESNRLLLEAADKGNVAVFLELIKNGAEVNATDKNGRTPLHWAAFKNDAVAIKILILNGANLEARDIFNFTPQHGAAYRGQVNAIELLIANGADVTAIGKDGIHRYIMLQGKIIQKQLSC